MIIGLIPSRLKSTRLFEKPLIKIDGLPVIIHTMRRAMLSNLLDDLYVCTDSTKIAETVSKYGGKFILTSTKHKNGTERIGEAIKKISSKAKLIVDIQGDEPTINPSDIDRVIRFHIKNYNFDIVIPHIDKKNKNNPNYVKIISNSKGKIFYLTRSDVPFSFSKKDIIFKKHLSVITFKKKALEKYIKAKQSELEKIEGIELNRALENNFELGTFRLKNQAIDVREDIKTIKDFFKRDKIRKLY